jgi:hypothetical protein
MAGTAGAVHHRQEQRWANKEAAQQAEADQAMAVQQAQYEQAQMQAEMAEMKAQLAAQQAQAAPPQQVVYAPAPAAPAPVAPAPVAASAGPDRITQLKELAELKQAGVLTDAEFEAEKAKILASG